jgi:hypothetical protein
MMIERTFLSKIILVTLAILTPNISEKLYARGTESFEEILKKFEKDLIEEDRAMMPKTMRGSQHNYQQAQGTASRRQQDSRRINSEIKKVADRLDKLAAQIKTNARNITSAGADIAKNANNASETALMLNFVNIDQSLVRRAEVTVDDKLVYSFDVAREPPLKSRELELMRMPLTSGTHRIQSRFELSDKKISGPNALITKNISLNEEISVPPGGKSVKFDMTLGQSNAAEKVSLSIKHEG